MDKNPKELKLVTYWQEKMTSSTINQLNQCLQKRLDRSRLYFVIQVACPE